MCPDPAPVTCTDLLLLLEIKTKFPNVFAPQLVVVSDCQTAVAIADDVGGAVAREYPVLSLFVETVIPVAVVMFVVLAIVAGNVTAADALAACEAIRFTSTASGLQSSLKTIGPIFAAPDK
jgi:hypothetical protein